MISAKHYRFAYLFLLWGWSSGMDLVPDSLSVLLKPLESYHRPIDTIQMKNSGAAAVTIDSITIRFLNGDSSDFRMGINCTTCQYTQYMYQGWVYGYMNKSLRYVRDSLFLLQDSAGNPVSFSIAPNDSSQFFLCLIVNCPVCGRMPSFPKTTKYLYLFHHSVNVTDTLAVTIEDITGVKNKTIRNRVANRRKRDGETYNLMGGKLGKDGGACRGMIINGQRRTVRLGGK